MTSGDGNATGRVGCLKGDEVDPQGIASPCVTPTASVSVAPSMQSLPTVGAKGDWFFISVIWSIALAVVVYMILSRGNRWK